MTSITAHSRIQRKSGIVSAEINGETVMMSVELGEYYGLNPIAADIWQRLAEPVVLETLVQDLADSYEGDPAAIQTDVQDLLEGFAAKGLLIVAE